MIATQLDHDAILAAICANPLDPLPRMVMRDYWEERGDALRVEAWQELEGKCPSEEESLDGIHWWWYGGDTWLVSSNDRNVLATREWTHCMIDDSLYPDSQSSVVYFNTCARAFIGAVEGYVKWKRG